MHTNFTHNSSKTRELQPISIENTRILFSDWLQFKGLACVAAEVDNYKRKLFLRNVLYAKMEDVLVQSLDQECVQIVQQ